MPFTWSLGTDNITLYSHRLPDEFEKLVHPQQRDIYVGP